MTQSRLQALLDQFAVRFDTSVEASDHSYGCRCPKCLEWWATVGPDEDDDGNPTWGPFTEDEIEAYRQGVGPSHDDPTTVGD
jgi:hypothetical protein